VEHRMLARLVEIARERGLDRLRIDFTSTAKNSPAREFLESIGATFHESSGPAHQFEFSAASIAGVCEPGSGAPAPSNCQAKTTFPPASPIALDSQNRGNRRSQILKRIAVELYDSSKVSRAVAASSVIRTRAAAGYFAPQTSLQESLASLWAEILKVDAVGIHDNFFELGGHSLMAMQLAFKIEETFNVDFPLESFLRTPALAAQADMLQELLLNQAGNADYLEQLIDDLERHPEDSLPSSAKNVTIRNTAREVM
jgi:acyl carrier protein